MYLVFRGVLDRGWKRDPHICSKGVKQKRREVWRKIRWGLKTRWSGRGESFSSSARWLSQETQPSVICAHGSESPGITKHHHHQGQWQAKDILSPSSHQTFLSSGRFQASSQVTGSWLAPLQRGPNCITVWKSLSWATWLLWGVICLQKCTYCWSGKWHRDWRLLPSSLSPSPVFPNPGAC